MCMDPSVAIFGPIDTYLAPYLEYLLLAVVVVNLGARAKEYNEHVNQADDGGDDAVSRNPIRVGTNGLLVVGGFYYATVHYHAGVVFSMLVVGLFITDLFEFESRKVEARREISIERPKGAIAASMLVLLYITYQALFFLVAPYWDAVV